MIARCLPLFALLLAACGGGGNTGQVAPLPEAEAALQTFLGAAADSNFIGMSENWGNARGPASETGSPSDFQRRMVIAQAFLDGATARVLSNDPVQNINNQRVLQVELSRGGCVSLLPFTMIRTDRGRWLVYSFDLEKIGNPSRTCNQGGNTPPG